MSNLLRHVRVGRLRLGFPILHHHSSSAVHDSCCPQVVGGSYTAARVFALISPITLVYLGKCLNGRDDMRSISSYPNTTLQAGVGFHCKYPMSSLQQRGSQWLGI